MHGVFYNFPCWKITHLQKIKRSWIFFSLFRRHFQHHMFIHLPLLQQYYKMLECLFPMGEIILLFMHSIDHRHSGGHSISTVKMEKAFSKFLLMRLVWFVFISTVIKMQWSYTSILTSLLNILFPNLVRIIVIAYLA